MRTKLDPKRCKNNISAISCFFSLVKLSSNMGNIYFFSHTMFICENVSWRKNHIHSTLNIPSKKSATFFDIFQRICQKQLTIFHTRYWSNIRGGASVKIIIHEVSKMLEIRQTANVVPAKIITFKKFLLLDILAIVTFIHARLGVIHI